jgi:cytosine/adenosine deaminase-related metal-dependent hydrolase
MALPDGKGSDLAEAFQKLMAVRFLTATRIHDGRRFLPEGTALELAEDGAIAAVHNAAAAGSAEQFDGVLAPGFVNVHCHLELSHMRGMIPERTGLVPFLQAVTRQRAGFTDDQKRSARHEAYAELLRNGVVAVGDIANTSDTLDLRAEGNMHVHTFVECIGFTEAGAAARLAYSAEILAHFAGQSSDRALLRQSIVPHAPYSVSPALFHFINAAEEGSALSIHNQESSAEDEYYRGKSGAIRDLLEGFGIDDSFFSPSGKSSLQTYLPWISESHPLILVHNTFCLADDVAFAQRRSIAPFWCLCPGANRYIEGRLPDVPMLRQITDNVCIGTDSLASNKQLSIFAELQLLKAAFPELEWEDLLRWATRNGARALQMDAVVGSFAPGLRPGVVHISSLGADAIVQRIV